MDSSDRSDAAGTSPGRRRLMLVDRPGAVRAAAAARFAACGWEVVLAADGGDALTQALARRVDVMIIDVTLPGLPGWEAASVVKRLDPTVEVILTSDTEVADTGETRHVEQFRCFPKPFDLEALVRAVVGHGGASAEVQP